MKRTILALLVVVPVVGIGYWVSACPCDRTPGVYPVTLTRVVDAAELDAAWNARAVKVSGGGNAERPADWWSFRVTSR